MVDLFKRKSNVVKAAKKPAGKVTPEERYRMVEQSAYFKAEKAGFKGDPKAFWLAAEKEVERLVGKKK